jgi:putative Mg2+ transporter-C (MgtC) family protein
MDTLTIVTRLLAALAVGCVIGVDREIRHKSAGVRTHSLVSIGSSVLVMSALDSGMSLDAVARVIQGLVAGIGFVGAGVILHHHRAEHRIEGLTTAASVWIAAGLGCAAGLGTYRVLSLGLVAALVVLMIGGPFERALSRRFRSKPEAGKAGGDDSPDA